MKARHCFFHPNPFTNAKVGMLPTSGDSLQAKQLVFRGFVRGCLVPDFGSDDFAQLTKYGQGGSLQMAERRAGRRCANPYTFHKKARSITYISACLQEVPVPSRVLVQQHSDDMPLPVQLATAVCNLVVGMSSVPQQRSVQQCGAATEDRPPPEQRLHRYKPQHMKSCIHRTLLCAHDFFKRSMPLARP